MPGLAGAAAGLKLAGATRRAVAGRLPACWRSRPASQSPPHLVLVLSRAAWQLIRRAQRWEVAACSLGARTRPPATGFAPRARPSPRPDTEVIWGARAVATMLLGLAGGCDGALVPGGGLLQRAQDNGGVGRRGLL